jgi:hypothetical protein
VLDRHPQSTVAPYKACMMVVVVRLSRSWRNRRPSGSTVFAHCPAVPARDHVRRSNVGSEAI